MFDEPFELQDEVLAVVEQYQSFAQSYRTHAVDLLNRFWPYGSDAASADLGVGSDLLIHLAQLVTMEAYTADLLAVLEEYEERRVSISANRPQPPSGSGSAET
jgi:hypothetical protein